MNAGAFDEAQLWADRTAWPLNERTPYDELAELACMSALAAWLQRWLPIAIHDAMRAGNATSAATASQELRKVNTRRSPAVSML